MTLVSTNESVSCECANAAFENINKRHNETQEPYDPNRPNLYSGKITLGPNCCEYGKVTLSNHRCRKRQIITIETKEL